MKKKIKTVKLADKIKKSKATIIANSNDATFAKKELSYLLSLQKQADIEAVELVVPTKEVEETIEFDSFLVKRTPRGILYQCKNGVSTFVESRATGVYNMLSCFFNKTEVDDETLAEMIDVYKECVSYVMQAPIFASVDTSLSIDLATHIIRAFNEYVSRNAVNAELHEETAEDIAANKEFADAVEALNQIADSDIPTNEVPNT